jgi:hypothetical protein
MPYGTITQFKSAIGMERKLSKESRRDLQLSKVILGEPNAAPCERQPIRSPQG